MREKSFTPTPGPWFAKPFGDSFCVFHGESRIAYCYSAFENRDSDESHANARLMAASPELFEACELALRFATESYEIESDRRQTIATLKAALQKALGECPVQETENVTRKR